ncbi:MAG: HmuY family protein [Treponema sp.]|jgi:hypothetical protein|nr:HmuY family protein [Treponema sp.]
MTNQTKKHCRMLRAGALSAAFLFTALAGACDLNGGDDNEKNDYPIAIAAVDYAGADPGRAVFINFSDSESVVTSLPHDFFDLAMYSIGSGQSSEAHIVANSGSYGTGAQVLKTDGTDIAADLSAHKNAVIARTFREGVELYGRQENANPLSGASSATTKNVYLIKVQYGAAEASYYKVIFNSYGPMGRCKITVVPGAEAGEEGRVELEAGLSGIADGYGYIYFDLHSPGGPRVLNDGNALKEGVTTALPKAADWDLLCTRTDEYLESAERPNANRSSILLNTVKGVEACTAREKRIDEVVSTEGLKRSAEVDAIGWQWYTSDNRGGYTVNIVTYVVKTAEGNYAKFQPGTFSGLNKENFNMKFRYYYVENDTGIFDR